MSGFPVEACSVHDWLLDSDPALRWQVLRDLTDAPPDEVAAERSRVAVEGWGARLLALHGEDGQWAGGACFPAGFNGDFSLGQPWTSTLPTLTLLCDLGVDPASEHVRETIQMVRDNCRWEHAGQPFFAGEVEPCINGRIVGLGAYFGVDTTGIVDRLLDEQLSDGGWNCEAENGSVRSSFNTTICVLEGLLQHERETGGMPDPRLRDAVELVRSKQDPDSRWLSENTHHGTVHFAINEADGKPSRWNTLRALRVLNWYDGHDLDR